MSHNPYCPHLLQNRTPSLLPKLLYIIFGFGKMEGTHSETKDISFSDRSKKTATNSTTESSAYIWTLCGGNNMSVLTEIGNWEKETPLIERVLLNNMWIVSVAQQYVDRTSDTPHSSAGRHPYLLTWFPGGTWHQLLLVAHWFRCMYAHLYIQRYWIHTNKHCKNCECSPVSLFIVSSSNFVLFRFLRLGTLFLYFYLYVVPVGL